MRILVTSLLALAAALPAQTLRGVVDVHAHCDPDVVPRSIDGIALARLAAQRGMRAVVLKNHYEPTASMAWLAMREVPDIQVFGSIALNRAVGGVNPAAVERMARLKGGLGRVVWMPTFDAENQVRVSREDRPSVPISRAGALLPEVKEVLDLIARYKLVLASGHNSAAENLLLVREAKARGVGRVMLTHPMVAPVSMTVPQMKEAAALAALIEFPANIVIGRSVVLNVREYVALMRAVGFENVILSSDFGQAVNPLHPDGLEQYFAALLGEGVSAAQIDRMARTNPARLLGLE